MEDWNSILYVCLVYGSNSVLSVFYLISWIFIGNYILLNLFLAILLDSFTEEDSVDALEIEEEKKEARVAVQ
jgi:hypothetical protein